MGHTVKYDQPTRRGRLAAALIDAQSWLSSSPKTKRKLQEFLQVMKACDVPARTKVRTAYLACEFVGIRWLPARAIIKHVWAGGEL